MKKFTTKLLMSIIAVAFAFVALGTSTYAWFAMNTTVSATGMEVGAKSNSTYLLISKTNNTAAGIQGENITTVDVAETGENTLVLPSKPKETAEVAASGAEPNYTTTFFANGTTVVSDATTAAAAANWYTATSHDPSAAIDFDEGANDIHSLNTTSGNTYEFSKYVIKKTVYLTLAVGSNKAYNLTVTPTIAKKVTNPAQDADDISAVKVLVACGDNFKILDSSMTTAQTLYDTTNYDLTDGSVLTVDIYIYYDGSESIVTTNTSADLATATISLAFGVTLKPEA